jgi:hypothetical protein
MLTNPTDIKEIIIKQNLLAISGQVSPALLIGVSAGNCQRFLVDESSIIRTQMGTHNGSEIVEVRRSPCVPAP